MPSDKISMEDGIEFQARLINKLERKMKSLGINIIDKNKEIEALKESIKQKEDEKDILNSQLNESIIYKTIGIQ